MAQENQRFKFKVKFSSEKAAREADQSHEYSKTTLSIRKFNFFEILVYSKLFKYQLFFC